MYISAKKQKGTYRNYSLNLSLLVFGFDNSVETIFALGNQNFFAPPIPKMFSKLWLLSRKLYLRSSPPDKHKRVPPTLPKMLRINENLSPKFRFFVPIREKIKKLPFAQFFLKWAWHVEYCCCNSAFFSPKIHVFHDRTPKMKHCKISQTEFFTSKC